MAINTNQHPTRECEINETAADGRRIRRDRRLTQETVKFRILFVIRPIFRAVALRGAPWGSREAFRKGVHQGMEPPYCQSESTWPQEDRSARPVSVEEGGGFLISQPSSASAYATPLVLEHAKRFSGLNFYVLLSRPGGRMYFFTKPCTLSCMGAIKITGALQLKSRWILYAVRLSPIITPFYPNALLFQDY